ncbi:MAG: histidine kinase [Anaerolineae bacterium]|nr:PAS domain-containing protein [Anaerolineales bacterium]MCQ3980568.1 histidine kinase [Anaerolineae bacterium]
MTQEMADDKFAMLRQQAETILRGQPADLSDLSPADIQALIHNLQVHQLELELQNEELRRAQLELQAARNRYADLYNFAPVGYFTLDVNGAIVEANLTGATLLNVTRSDLIGAPLARFVAKEDWDKYAVYRVRLGQSEEPQRIEIKLVRQADAPFHAQLEGIAAYDQAGRFTQSRITVGDITERVRAEAMLHESERLARLTEQLRELSARLQSVREEERTRISRAIHDELGQTLTGLKMDVAWLQGHLEPPQPALLAKMQAMSGLIDTTIQTVRRISTELRPGILDLGLVATIEWQLQEFQTRTGIETHLISAPEETTLDDDRSTAVYRIFQEILTNVVRHAEATQVEVTLEETAAFLTLQVRDNGRGITASEIDNPKSIGLLGMQERARLRGGEVHLSGSPGRGTTVTVRLPLTTVNSEQ